MTLVAWVLGIALGISLLVSWRLYLSMDRAERQFTALSMSDDLEGLFAWMQERGLALNKTTDADCNSWWDITGGYKASSPAEAIRLHQATTLARETAYRQVKAEHP